MIFLSVFTLEISQAGTVRTVYSDGVKMTPIHLRMGQSTVLRFTERPKKVVLGNSNYYSVEFIENDLAIQPQGAMTTNLFVYGQKNVYGFILSTNQSSYYDDLVQVDLVENKIQKTEQPQKKWFKEISSPKQSVTVGKELRFTLEKIYKIQGKEFYLMDLFIENISGKDASLKNLEIYFQKEKVRLSPQELTLKKEVLKRGEITQARIFVAISSRSDVSLLVANGKPKSKMIVKARSL